jgi:phosphoadenosine phosphosulfate reductase
MTVSARKSSTATPLPHIWRLPAELTSPEDIIVWAAPLASRPFLSTNFRPMSAALLHMVTQQLPDIPVVWVDTGYNTPATYRFAEAVASRLRLDLHIYTPTVTVARRASVLGGVPPVGHPEHAAFTREVKLAPFERAVRELAPDVWFTGIRAEQNDYRRSLGVVSNGPGGSMKVAPVFHWTRLDLDDYLYRHDLPDNDDYFDPTKGEDTRECGLQFLGSGI